MDKKSNRTDLLAAGRKKLEQYRQKNSKGKDGKGKHGKSSSKSTGKAGKSEQHDDDDSVVTDSAVAPTESSQVPVHAPQLHPDSESSTSTSLENSEDSTLNKPIDSAVSVPVLDDNGSDKATSVGAVELHEEDSQEIKISSSISKDMKKLPVHLTDNERASTGIPILEAENADLHPSTTSFPSGVCEDEDNTDPVEVHVLKKEDQVSSDVGAMQEVHGSSSKDCDGSLNIGQQEDASLSVPLVESSMRSAESYTACIADDGEKSIKEAYVSLASDSVGKAVSLMKLVDVIKGLPEDDFVFLIKSRNLINSNSLSVQEEHTDVCGVLLAHLYNANISKEFLHLQLLEASKHEHDMDCKNNHLANEIAVLEASLIDVNERNNGLYVELTECRSELRAAICQKDELQSQIYSADAEVKELSSKVDELKIVIEESSRSFSKLSEELDCCKDQLANSLEEKERLVNSLVSITEEKNTEMVLKEQLLGDKHSRQLTGCRILIDALEVEVASLNVSLAVVTDERMIVEEETQCLSAKNEKLSVNLADYRCLMNALEDDNRKLNATLDELREGTQMIEEMKENLVYENERLSHEVSVCQERISEEHAQFIQLEGDLKQARLHHEQLMEENICLSSTLEIYKGKIAEISRRNSNSSSQERLNVANADDLQNIPEETVTEESDVASKPAFDDTEERLPVSHHKGDIYDDCSGFVMLKGHLEEAEQFLQDLAKGMEGMYSHSMTLSHSIGRSAAPGISKLIQAFESKPQSGENESEVSETAGDAPYISAKHHLESLRLLLKEMYQDIVQASNFARFEKEGRQTVSSSLGQLLVEVKSWKDSCADKELHNIELWVQYEVMKQHMCSMEVKHNELKTSYESVCRKENSLTTQNIQLAEKLMHCHSKIDELFDQLDKVRKSSRGIASNIHSDLEELRKDLTEKISKVEGALASFSMAAQRLDAAMGSSAVPPNPNNSSDESGRNGQIVFTVNAACQMIEDLKERVETASRENKALTGTYEELSSNFDALVGENRSAVDLLQKIFADLVNCLDGFLGHAEESDTQPEEFRCYNAGQFNTVMIQISSLLNERRQLKELNDNLNSELLSRSNDDELLKKRSFESDLLVKLVDNVRDVLKLTPADMNSDEPSLLLLQSLFSLLAGKYKDAGDHVRLLQDDLNSRTMEFRELQECVESLNSINFQQQNEIFVLKQSLKHAQDSFDITQDQLLKKATELEHCEQRFASIREKLSIAVAKGKGLIVQRDSLKQSLSETSIELERCSQELQLKEARLNEVEHKLKAYSEAGERVEALESELSYIRNSATALRESFLLKDSALQRIEEILEDLELPEHFHSRDIVEKVNYLANPVAANSLLAADWEQRSAMADASFSDASIVKTDSWKDESQPSFNPVDDLRRQYDELQKRFFALAEQNEMLEQSLIERNNLVQRWEGVLDRIDTPVQIRSMEPDERIQWLGTALSEADHHMSSLQQKVDNLESYCTSMAADLEESERRVSELEFSLQTVTRERNDMEKSLIGRNNLLQRWQEVLDKIDTPLPVRSMELEERIQWLGNALSQADYQMKSLQKKFDSLETYCATVNANFEKSHTQVSGLRFSLDAVNSENVILSADLADLRSEHEKSLERTAHLKHVADDLRSEVDTLQRKLAEKLEIEKHILQIEGQMLRWRELIIETLQSCGTESLLPDGSSPVECLEILIQRLVDDYVRFRTEIQQRNDNEDDNIPDSAAGFDETRVASAVDVNMLEFDNTIPPESRERDVAEEVESAVDLRKELDDAINELTYLKEERDEYMKKSQSLLNELEELEKKKEVLQNQRNQEEQKSTSLREKLNVAVKKGKSLVQHRDALKQSIEGFTAEIGSLKSELKMRDISVAVFEQKIKDLSSQVEIGHVLESENTSLKNRLLETKQHLQEREDTLSLLLEKLDEINIGSEVQVNNPVQKLEEIQKEFYNLHGAVVSSEQETKKSKRAAELLLAELNEVQERNDNLQEDLAKAYSEISELSRQKDVAESAKLQVISHIQELSEEARKQQTEYDLLKSNVHKLERNFSDVAIAIADVFATDMDLLHRLRDNMESCIEAIGSDLQLPGVSGVLMSWIADKQGYLATYSLWGSEVRDLPDDIRVCLSQLTRDTEQLKERVHSDFLSLHDEAELLLKFVGNLHSEAISIKRSLNSIQAEYIHLQSAGKKRDMEYTVMHECISSLHEVCCSSIMEIESKAQVVENGFQAEDIGSKLKALPLGDGGLNFREQDLSTSKEHVKILGDTLLLAIRDFVTMHARSKESDHKEMRTTILNLQKELQEKDVQKERMCMELVSQIKDAEATAKSYSGDLQSANVQAHNLEKRLQLMGEERKSLEIRIADMQHKQVASVELQDKVASLTDLITAKDKEIEALMQALDEEENQMEGLKDKVEKLEVDLKKQSQDIEQAVAARAKALKKLSITVCKFDELHHMSEGLLSEIENLQTQLQDRESEISFLRQEVTRCTNDALLASKTAKERNAEELQDLLKWLEIACSQVIVHSGDNNNHQNIEPKEQLRNSITSIIAEFEELRIALQRKDSLLAERNRVEELLRGKEALEASVHQMESHLNSIRNPEESGQSASEIVEVESVINSWVAPVASTASQVRSLRKSNNEQVTIAIDTDTTESGRIEDEDDDKVHGFKSLATSKFVPKFTRPVSDMIDGLWVSCDRTLMRQPGMRLGIMIYWAILHALLATFVV
ncbi:hypothetical protein V2J09_010862 [Rumex salicifolius]